MWWILLFGISPQGDVTEFAFLQAPAYVQTFEECEAVIPTLNVSLATRGGVASCFRIPNGVHPYALVGRRIPGPSDKTATPPATTN